MMPWPFLVKDGYSTQMATWDTSKQKLYGHSDWKILKSGTQIRSYDTKLYSLPLCIIEKACTWNDKTLQRKNK